MDEIAVEYVTAVQDLYRAWKALKESPELAAQGVQADWQTWHSPDAVVAHAIGLSRIVMVTGWWYPRSFYGFVKEPEADGYMIYLHIGKTDVYITGDLDSSLRPTTAEVMLALRDSEGRRRSERWVGPSGYEAEEIREALLWYSRLFSYSSEETKEAVA